MGPEEPSTLATDQIGSPEKPPHLERTKPNGKVQTSSPSDGKVQVSHGISVDPSTLAKEQLDEVSNSENESADASSDVDSNESMTISLQGPASPQSPEEPKPASEDSTIVLYPRLRERDFGKKSTYKNGDRVFVREIHSAEFHRDDQFVNSLRGTVTDIVEKSGEETR